MDGKTMFSGIDSSGGFAVSKAATDNRKDDFHKAVPEFITTLANDALKTRLSALWETYETAYNEYGEILLRVNDEKTVAQLVLNSLTDFLRNLYYNTKNGSYGEALMGASQLGWERVNSTLDQFGYRPENFSEALESSQKTWEKISDDPKKFAADNKDYQSMVTQLENAVNDCHAIAQGGSKETISRVSEFGRNALSLFKMLVKDLTQSGFVGEFYWVSPANQDYTDIDTVQKTKTVEAEEIQEETSEEVVEETTEKAEELPEETPAVEGEVVAEKPVDVEAEQAPIPDNVPNYRLALDVSPRVCGNCRFFNGKEGVGGECSIYNFTAKANHVCDAWQSTDLTPTHTPVRTANMSSIKAKEDKLELAKVEKVSGSPKEIEGKVTGRANQLVGINDVLVEQEMNVPYNESINTRSAKRQILPGDRVVSASLRSLAIVTSVLQIEEKETPVYNIKLIDSNGISFGSATVLADDLTLKGDKALKIGTNTPVKSDAEAAAETEPEVKSETDSAGIEKMREEAMQKTIERVRAVRKSIVKLAETHADVETSPAQKRVSISVKNEIDPLIEEIKSELASEIFEDVKSGARRKYYRAMQNAEHCLGAARQFLFDGFKKVLDLQTKAVQSGDIKTKSQYKATMRRESMDTHVRAYTRIKEAIGHLDDALTTPSATHDLPAPGLE